MSRVCRIRRSITCVIFFFFNDTATTEIYTLSLHDALPICTVFEGWRRGNMARCGPFKPEGTPSSWRWAWSLSTPAPSRGCSTTAGAATTTWASAAAPPTATTASPPRSTTACSPPTPSGPTSTASSSGTASRSWARQARGCPSTRDRACDGLAAERLAAAAAAGGVGVADLEGAAHELVDEVDADAVEHAGVLRVDEELHAVGGEGLLAGRSE